MSPARRAVGAPTGRLLVRRAGLLAALTTSLWLGADALEAATQPQVRWYKGNTHTHTLNSDGDSSPDDVARWYREHGYQFLVLSDHNYLTGVDGLNALMGADEKFLLIPGEEVTSRFDTKAIHVNGLGVTRLVAPTVGAAGVVETIQGNVDAIRAANGVPHINHPSFTWAFTADEIGRVRNNKLFELFNGHPQVNNEGGGGVPSLEAAWDTLLSRGTMLYGIAVDDAHTFKRPWDATAARPGQGWIVVRAARLGAREILDAIERGDFYSSTGVDLSDIQVTPRSVSVTVREKTWAKYRIVFYGRGGRVLKEVAAGTARYDATGTEGYVRAKIIESSGRVAWTQPMLVSTR
jgi:hypothetical protein